MSGYGNLLMIVTVLLSICVYYFKRIYTYWDARGVLSAQGTFPYGVLQGVGKKYHMLEILKRYYDEFKGRAPFCGIYFFLSPIALITDMDLIKSILVKDFQNFQNRGIYHNEKDDPLTAHLVSLEGTKWKNLRAKLTPTFTSGKMKMMFPTIVAVSNQFESYLSKAITQSPEIEMKDVLARFTTDVIGSCAFGLDCDSLTNPDAKFRQMGRRVFDQPRNNAVKLFFMRQYRNLARALHMKEIRDDVSEFFMTVVDDIIKYREKSNVKRNDFMDLLINLKNTGDVDGKGDGSDSITFNEIAAQAFVFFLAGFETSSTAMSYALYELSLNQAVQDKARQCVKDVLKRYNGEMTYEAISEMTYIDQCINESLRQYPPATTLNRITQSDYKVPGTNHVIEKDTRIIIPIYAIQHDPQHYPNPEVYDPDRFSPEVSAKRNPYAFIPFGEGPRACIGLRFGIMQARVGLAVLLNNFKISPCSKSIIPLVIHKSKNILTSKDGLYLKVEKI